MVFARRTRMISFRVSESDFNVFRTKSEIDGARSISDYARLALREATGMTDSRIEAKLGQLAVEVRRLSIDIRRLTDLLEGPLPRPTQNGILKMRSSDGADA